MFLCHPIYLTKCSNCAFRFNVEALSTHPTAAATLGGRNSQLWDERRNMSPDVGKRGKELANLLLCQQLNSSKRFWWKDSSKVCYFVKAGVSQQNTIFDTAWSRKNTGTSFRCGPLPYQNNKTQNSPESEKSNPQLCCPLLYQADR